jgi:hypothetical protein
MKTIAAVLGLLLMSVSPSLAQGQAPLGLHEVVAIAPQADLRDRDLVRTIQRSLRAHGLYAGAIDGIAGPRTLEGLRLAQQLTTPWIVPVIRMDVRHMPQAVVVPAHPVYVTAPVVTYAAPVHLTAPAPVYAPVAPWQLPVLLQAAPPYR